MFLPFAPVIEVDFAADAPDTERMVTAPTMLVPKSDIVPTTRTVPVTEAMPVIEAA